MNRLETQTFGMDSPSEVEVISPFQGSDVRYAQHLHVKVSAELDGTLRAEAARQHKKLSEYVRDALREHVARACGGN